MNGKNIAADLSGDVPGRTWDELCIDNSTADIKITRPLSKAQLESLRRSQLHLCMVGDSVSWAEDGDYFRRELLELLPQLAFAGSHSALLGYAHAGEGGDSTVQLLRRLDDPERVPPAAYYHLLIGINDCSAAKSDDQSPRTAMETAARIIEIVERLLKKQCTCKVFVGSLLPSPFDMLTGESTVRERTGALVNEYLRKLLPEHPERRRIVWIEYEQPLRRELAEWKKPENLRGAHPTAQGYKRLAVIAAPVLKEHMQPQLPDEQRQAGVEVVNLYCAEKNCSLPLIPGWYTLSMQLAECSCLEFKLFSLERDPEKRFEQSFQLSGAPGTRVEVNFMTGYENFGYTKAPFALEFSAGRGQDIQIEKMRPLQHASCYGRGRFVDTVSPIAPGEVLVNKP